MNKVSEQILILGLGNDILKDDGIGPRLAVELKTKITDPLITYEIAAVGGMELIEMIRDFHHVIIIDSIKTRDGIPGSVYNLTPSDFKETLHISNLHDISFLTALKMAKSLGIYITDKIDIIAIEIVEDMEFGLDYTPAIQQKIGKIKSQVFHMVETMLNLSMSFSKP